MFKNLVFVKMANLRCALCDSTIEVLEYDLQKSCTIYSNSSLLEFLQNSIQEKFEMKASEICKMCYLLFNELDSIKIRAKVIEDQFRNFLSRYKANETNMEQCTVCLKKFHVKDLKVHLKSQHPELSDLDSSFDFDGIKLIEENPSLDEININVEAQVKPETKVEGLRPYKCQECPKTWRTATELKNHMSAHDNVKPFICEICGQAYKKQRALDIHIGMHNGINPFTCVYCNKSFTQKGALVRHTPIHTGELPFQCDLCGKRFVHHTSFNMHKLSHTGEKSYKCDVCGLFLMSGSHLKRHMRVHTGEKKYSCESCGKKFAEKYNLAAHEKLHSGGHRKQRFQCQICDCSYNRQVKLEEHLLAAHQKIVNPQDSGKKC